MSFSRVTDEIVVDQIVVALDCFWFLLFGHNFMAHKLWVYKMKFFINRQKQNDQTLSF